MEDSGYVTLQRLPNHHLPIYTSPGIERRAEVLAVRFERAYRFLTTAFAIAPPIQLAVLSVQDWPKYAQSPLYGAVFYDYPQRTIVVGGEPASFWQAALDLIGAEAPALLERLRATYASAAGPIDISQHVDLWLAHDLGHACHLHHDYWFPRKWLMEFFASLCFYTYIAENEPEQLAIAETFLLVMQDLPARLFRYHTLEEFEERYTDMPIENYLWFSGHFLRQARDAYTRMGPAALQHVWHTFVTAGIADLSHQELASVIARAAPALAHVLHIE